MRLRARVLISIAVWSALSLIDSLKAAALAPIQDFSAEADGSSLIRLTTGWNFIWDSFINPGQMPESVDATVQLPKVWNGIDIERNGQSSKVPSLGYASYVLRFKGLSRKVEGYQIEISGVSSAYQAFIYPEDKPQLLIPTRSGHISKDSSALPSRMTRTLSFQPRDQNEVWVLLLQVSNFHAYKGGIWGVPLLGKKAAIDQMRIYRASMELFCLGATSFVGLYSLMMFVRRREDLASLSLFGAAVFGMLRILSTGDWLFLWFGEEGAAVFRLQTGIAYITVIVPVIFLVWFLHHSFREYSAPRFVLGLSVYAMFLGILTLILPPTFYMRFLYLYQLPLVPIAFYSLRVFVGAFKSQSVGVAHSFFGLVVLGMTIVYDVLISLGKVDPPYITQFGVVVFMFMQSQVIAIRFSRAFRMAEHLQQKLQIEVDKQTSQIRMIMDHVPQGICLVYEDLCIKGQYARSLETIFDTRSIHGAALCDLLYAGTQVSAETRSIAENTLHFCFGNELLNFEINEEYLPREVTQERDGKNRILEINWHPMLDKFEHIETFLVTVRDITRLRLLEEQTMKRDRELQQIFELLQADQEKMRKFWPGAEAGVRHMLHSLEEPGSETRERLRRIYNQLHTLKGEARSFKLSVLTSFVHDTETMLADLQNLKDPSLGCPAFQQRLEALLQIIVNYQFLMTTRILNQAQNHALIDKEMEDLGLQIVDMPTKTLTLDKILPVVERLKAVFVKYVYQSINHFLEGFQGELDRLAIELGKPPPILVVDAPGIFLRKKYEQALSGALMHLLRNSLDHSFESADERKKKGKPERGSVRLSWQRQGALYSLWYSDDGRGLDLEAVRSTAAKKGLRIDVSDEQLADYMFTAGFSTKQQLTEISGRGVGMDAVRDIVEELGGSITVQLSAKGRDEIHCVAIRFEVFLPEEIFFMEEFKQLPKLETSA